MLQNEEEKEDFPVPPSKKLKCETSAVLKQCGYVCYICIFIKTKT